MKEFILLLSIMTNTFTAKASDYPYLTFEMTDGTKVSVQTSSISINISSTTLTVGDQTFTLTNLSKMYFSPTNLTTNITPITVSEWNTVTEIFDINGRKVRKEQLQKGVYVIRNKKGNYKIAAK